MTGRALIELIQKNHAEDMPVVIQYRDAAGGYAEGEDAEFNLAKAIKNTDTHNCYDWDLVIFSEDEPNVILL